MLRILVSILMALLMAGCPSVARIPSDHGGLAVRVEIVDGDGYRIAAGKVLGDVLSQASFTIDGDHLPGPVTKTLGRADWTNPDGSYRAITAAFGDLLPGEVAVTVTGTGISKGLTVLAGSAVMTVVAGQVTPGVLTAQYHKGDLELGLDPNVEIPKVK